MSITPPAERKITKNTKDIATRKAKEHLAKIYDSHEIFNFLLQHVVPIDKALHAASTLGDLPRISELNANVEDKVTSITRDYCGAYFYECCRALGTLPEVIEAKPAPIELEVYDRNKIVAFIPFSDRSI